MNKYLIALLLLVITSVFFSQEPNIAAIVDEDARKVDIVFITKVLVMLFIGIIAFLSYLKYRKTEH